jgi:uncharacterized metal-binding protein YceD (DUF177 family)
MIPDSVGPLSRPIAVDRIPEEGLHAVIEATEEERAALAADLNLPGIDRLTARFRVTGTPDHVRVSGRVEAALRQSCVVSLDVFEATLDEEVEVEFQSAPALPANGEGEQDADRPDEIVDGRIDLGALAAEFFVLGLDPYPRKPGVDFVQEPEERPEESPFAALSRLTRDG